MSTEIGFMPVSGQLPNHGQSVSNPLWDLQFTSVEREDERTLHGWIADLLPRTELEVIAKRGDRR